MSGPPGDISKRTCVCYATTAYHHRSIPQSRNVQIDTKLTGIVWPFGLTPDQGSPLFLLLSVGHVCDYMNTGPIHTHNMLRFQALFVVLPLAMVAGQTCDPPCAAKACQTATCDNGVCVYSNQADGTACKSTFLGGCYEGICCLVNILQGCETHMDSSSCNADQSCSWAPTNPSSCPNKGCPNANCAAMAPSQTFVGLQCENCVASYPFLYCNEALMPTTVGGCLKRSCFDIEISGTVLSGMPFDQSDFTREHTESIEVAFLKDFSTVTAASTPSGEVLRLPDSTIHLGDVMLFNCQDTADCPQYCDVYLMAYHCPTCPGSVESHVVSAAVEEGWEVSSCAPELHIGNEETPRPMITFRKNILAGNTVSFPTVGDLNYVLILAFRRNALDDCTSHPKDECGTGGCRYFNNKCLDGNWCPKRFSKGPSSPGRSCSATCPSMK